MLSRPRPLLNAGVVVVVVPVDELIEEFKPFFVERLGEEPGERKWANVQSRR